MHNLDRYYTPRGLAEELLTECLPLDPNICIDSTCGGGDLLTAANTVFGDIHCIGIDKDKNAIEALRRQNPLWTLSVADLLNPRSFNRTRVATEYQNSDLLIINPPFSNGRRKTHHVVYKGRSLSSSIAMAHILTSLELFKPHQGALIIAPESLLYSENDAVARDLLFNEYQCTEIGDLHNSTFSGARAHSVAIRLSPNIHISSKHTVNTCNSKTLRSQFTRGGLPVHEKVYCPNGISYIHTTNLLELSNGMPTLNLTTVEPCARGQISGWVLLLPRVGIPNINALTPLFFQHTAQLSDCVIALTSNSRNNSAKIARRIKSNWEQFLTQYKGTGARYTTNTRLKECLNSMCISTDG